MEVGEEGEGEYIPIATLSPPVQCFSCLFKIIVRFKMTLKPEEKNLLRHIAPSVLKASKAQHRTILYVYVDIAAIALHSF